jgi:hypothetical protein
MSQLLLTEEDFLPSQDTRVMMELLEASITLERLRLANDRDLKRIQKCIAQIKDLRKKYEPNAIAL